MSNTKTDLAPGLYLVSVPIGNARDITLRALDILSGADVLAAEDTRSLKRLFEIHGLDLKGRQILAYHDHNGARMRPKLLERLADGQSLAYASEAGTPLIADPGFDLARAARENGYAVHAAPGASAILTALTLAGLPTDRFFFGGFLPNAKGQRRSALEALVPVPGTLVFYESPRRVGAMLDDAVRVFGGQRPAVVARELTKKFEDVRQGTLSDLAEAYAADPPRGECVVLIGPGQPVAVKEEVWVAALDEALTTMSVRDAADHVAATLGVQRRAVYQRALQRNKELMSDGGTGTATAGPARKPQR